RLEWFRPGPWFPAKRRFPRSDRFPRAEMQPASRARRQTLDRAEIPEYGSSGRKKRTFRKALARTHRPIQKKDLAPGRCNLQLGATLRISGSATANP